MQTRALLKLTTATLLGVALLVGLGLWQLERLEWKEGIITKIEARTEREPVPLERALELVREPGRPDYYPVRVEGRFHHDRERYLYALSLEGEPGWHVITPLETVNGEVVLVDRGFVPEAMRDPVTRSRGQIDEVAAVTGLIRSPETPGLFIPENEPERNQWFSRDLAAMSRSMFPGGTVEAAPFFLEAKKSDVPGGFPLGGQTRLTLTNNHLQYALTWFSLAVVLVAVYAAYVWGAYRAPRP